MFSSCAQTLRRLKDNGLSIIKSAFNPRVILGGFFLGMIGDVIYLILKNGVLQCNYKEHHIPTNYTFLNHSLPGFCNFTWTDANTCKLTCHNKTIENQINHEAHDYADSSTMDYYILITCSAVLGAMFVKMMYEYYKIRKNDNNSGLDEGSSYHLREMKENPLSELRTDLLDAKSYDAISDDAVRGEEAAFSAEVMTRYAEFNGITIAEAERRVEREFKSLDHKTRHFIMGLTMVRPVIEEAISPDRSVSEAGSINRLRS